MRRWGRPEITEPPVPKPEPIEQTKVEAKVAGGMTYTWTFEGDKRVEDALGLLHKLIGAPDENGWIRSVTDHWAVRPDELRSVRIYYTSRKAEEKE